MAREALVRISARPPKLFNSKVDFTLWMERLEIYFAEAEIPEEKKVKELCVLLEDDPFPIVSQLGLLESTDYIQSCEELSTTAFCSCWNYSGKTGSRIITRR